MFEGPRRHVSKQLDSCGRGQITAAEALRGIDRAILAALAAHSQQSARGGGRRAARAETLEGLGSPVGLASVKVRAAQAAEAVVLAELMSAAAVAAGGGGSLPAAHHRAAEAARMAAGATAAMSSVLRHATAVASDFQSAALCNLAAGLLFAFRGLPSSDARRCLQEAKALHLRLRHLPVTEWAPLAQELPPTEACRCGQLLCCSCIVAAQPRSACRPSHVPPLRVCRWPTDPPAEVATSAEAANQCIADALRRLETAVGVFERSDAQRRQQQQQQPNVLWIAELLGAASKNLLSGRLLPSAWMERIKVRAPSLCSTQPVQPSMHCVTSEHCGGAASVCTRE